MKQSLTYIAMETSAYKEYKEYIAVGSFGVPSHDSREEEKYVYNLKYKYTILNSLIGFCNISRDGLHVLPPENSLHSQQSSRGKLTLLQSIDTKL